MAKIDELLETIDTLTVVELAELVKGIEEKYGVSAAAVAAPAAGAGAAALCQGPFRLRSCPPSGGFPPAQHPCTNAQNPERCRVFCRQQYLPKSRRPGVAAGLSARRPSRGLQGGRRSGPLGMGS